MITFFSKQNSSVDHHIEQSGVTTFTVSCILCLECIHASLLSVSPKFADSNNNPFISFHILGIRNLGRPQLGDSFALILTGVTQ